MPYAFDDMLFNNLGGYAQPSDSKAGSHFVSSEFSLANVDSILGYLKKTVEWVESEDLEVIVDTASQIEDGSIESHFIYQSFPEESKFRFCIINVLREGNYFKVTVSPDEQTALGIQKAEIFHDVRSSTLGLPWVNRFVVSNTCSSTDSAFLEFNRERILKNIQVVRGSQKGEMLSFDFMAAISSAKSAVTAITDSWKEIVSAFKTIKSETLKEVIKGEGYNYFKSKSRFLRSIGIPTNKWDTYKKAYMTLTGIDKNKNIQKEMTAVLELAQFLPENAWNANEFTFDISKGGDCNAVVALTKNSMVDERAHIITVTAEGAFKLQPDTYIYTKYKSIAGGIYENTEDVRKNVPRELTAENVKAINALILLNAAQIMAENFGVPFKLPDDPYAA